MKEGWSDPDKMCPWFLTSYPSIIPILSLFSCRLSCSKLLCLCRVWNEQNPIFRNPLASCICFLFHLDSSIDMTGWFSKKLVWTVSYRPHHRHSLYSWTLSHEQFHTWWPFTNIQSWNLVRLLNCTSMWCWLKYFLRKNVKLWNGYIGKYFAVITITKDYL